MKKYILFAFILGIVLMLSLSAVLKTERTKYTGYMSGQGFKFIVLDTSTGKFRAWNASGYSGEWEEIEVYDLDEKEKYYRRGEQQQ